jgi:phenylglyoxylate dehydrogenase epsilon subunit
MRAKAALKRKHVIVGCGPAALAALEKIRSITSEDEITLVTKEDVYPYSPMILPYLLSGKIKEADFAIRQESYFQRMKSTLLKGKEVTAVQPNKKEVIYRNGDIDKYDTLLIACGSEPLRPSIRGFDAVGSAGLHTLADYRNLVQELENKKTVAVIGAGLIGMGIAAAILERGCKVSIVEKEDRVLPLYFDAEAAMHIQEIFVHKGAQVLVGAEVTEVERQRSGVEIKVRGNPPLFTDLLITAIGVKARSSLAQAAGIKTNRGIVVDKRMRTSIKDIYAAGDVAEAQGFLTNEHGMCPIVPTAVAQGEVAGANMAGENMEYQGWIPRNIFNFFGNSAFSVGLSLPTAGKYDEMRWAHERRKQYKKLIYQGDVLIGCTFLNMDVDPGIMHYLIAKGVHIGSHKEALFQRPKETSRWLMLEAERRQAFPSES